MATTPQRAPARPAVRPRPAAPHVSVVVINYCQWRSTDRLTRQLVGADAIDAGRADVIVVDNDSPPDPAAARLRRRPGVALKAFPRNTGFARAANEGCRLTRGDWVLLLNPDTAVPDGFLDQLDALCRSLDLDDPKVGVVGLSLVHGDGSPQASGGPPPTLFRTLTGLVLPRRIRKGRPVRGTDRVAVPWVTGCGMLIRRACWADIGGFDESFFLYYEDTDFCRRALAAGWTVWHEPGLRLTHFKPLHTRPVPPELRLMTRHALLTYADKYWPGWQAKALAGVVWAEALARHLRAVAGRTPAGLHRELRRLAGDWIAGRLLSARARVRRASGLLANCAGRDDDGGPLESTEAEALRAAG
ncbi:MAG TPA: glycosyltransferase family 2 protein [Gemmataceae bacterium]|jgi:N-acetylglucosaminyl-diphospho-decaprenol L-rhamnosyltransferase|nr:glycosyltransferase family 2 protein [Gemmataceae bacterium]